MANKTIVKKKIKKIKSKKVFNQDNFSKKPVFTNQAVNFDSKKDQNNLQNESLQIEESQVLEENLEEPKKSQESFEDLEKKENSERKNSFTSFNQKNKDIPKKAEKSLLDNIFSSLVGEKKEITRYQANVNKVLEFDEIMQKLTDQELKAKTQEFRNQLKGLNEKKEIDKKLNEILPEAFAVVREASNRTIGQKHFPVQLIGAMVLHEGRVAEMKTGEGKTLVATLATYLNALPQKYQVHVVTVNDYLARRDASWMGKIYDFLGLTIGVIQNQASFYFQLGAQADQVSDQKRQKGLIETWEDGEKEDSRTVLDVENLIKCERKRAYKDDENDKIVDIVYGVNSEFGFDYLRDNMANTPDEITQKVGHHVAIVDEVDSVLIDEARTPLIISAQDEDSSARYKQFAKIASQLKVDLDYEVDEKRKIVTLTDLGMEKIDRILGVSNIFGSEENVILIHHLDQALKAESLFRKDKEYVVKDGEIIIVDENTGRLMFGRRFNQGLHQAIEAKENLKVQAESKTTASITFQNYFRLYGKLAGMTGTAATESEELFKIYKLLVVSIPTNRGLSRIDKIDKIYKNESGKFTAIARDIKEIHSTGQPILIGTTSIEKNYILSQKLKEFNIPHEVLNAKNHEQEARIISRAGIKGSVTLATNIAGRGIDIKLGGEPPQDKEDKVSMQNWKKEHESIKKLGGLYVIGTERHESRRIDNQLRGRSGRQGDPGVSQFYVSLEDYILRVYGGDNVSFYSILAIPDDEAIQDKRLSWLIEQAQKKIEGQNYDVRKHVTEYDDVINRQRSVIYTRRSKVLLNEEFDWKVQIKETLYREVLRSISQVQTPKGRKPINQEQLNLAQENLKAILPLPDFDAKVIEVLLKDDKFNYQKTATFLTDKLNFQLKTRWEIYDQNAQGAMARFAFLRAIDVLWTEHLVTIDHLQDSVRLRGYSQRDPLTEFKEEGLKIFIDLLKEIDKEICQTIFKIKPELVPAGIMKTQ
jgi:preprotein translocase subunit SecA